MLFISHISLYYHAMLIIIMQQFIILVTHTTHTVYRI